MPSDWQVHRQKNYHGRNHHERRSHMAHWKKDWKLPLGLVGASIVAAGTAYAGRFLAGRAIKKFSTRLLTEPYKKNLWEAFSAVARTTPQTVVETSLRAEMGKKIKRPLGGPKNFPDFSNILFNPAQLQTFPLDESTPVDGSVTIGRHAQKPVRLEIPIIISGMAYGLALSEKAKIALAKGATMAGTATNSGQGPFLQEERQAARTLILQYNRGHWVKEPDILKQADMIEIQLGQGAMAGSGEIFKQNAMDKKMIRLLQLKPGEDAILHASQHKISSPGELGGLVKEIRSITEGIPVGVKIAAGNDLENDMAYIVEAGADFISIDGAQGGTHGTLPILEDDFGLPTLYALCRAVKFLEEEQIRDEVDLIISGGLKTPGDYLKALALGANAVAIGTVALFAMTHTQVFKALPYEPPIEVVFLKGKYQHKLNIDKGAQNLAAYLLSSADEMKTAARALGKNRLQAVDKNDLFTLDRQTAEIAGIDVGY